MKKITIKIGLFCSLFLILAFTTSTIDQEITEALDGIQKFYQNHPILYQEIDYQLFPNHDSRNIHSTEKGLLIIGPDGRYSKLASIESLTNMDFNIGIDHDDKTIMISNNFSNLSLDPLESIQTYLEQVSSASIQSISPKSNALQFKMEYGEVAETKIQYNTRDFQIEKITLLYRREIQLEDAEQADWATPRLEIVYSNTSFNGKENDRLNLYNYVSGSGKNWKTTDRYADYKLINNLHENPLKQ